MKSNLEIHQAENNSDSQSFVNENADKIRESCMMVLKLLRQGVRLTVKLAISRYDISSLPRRIKDLREMNGIADIKDKWIYKIKNGKRVRNYKVWYVDVPKRPTKKQVAAHWDKTIQAELFSNSK